MLSEPCLRAQPRRSYDRAQSSSSHTPRQPYPYHEATHSHWSYEGRKRGASHAWEYARRPNSRPSYTYSPPPGSSHYSHVHQRHPSAGPNPFHNPNVRRATGQKGPLPTGRGPTQADHVARESVFMRAAIVAGLVLLIATIGHGLSANAG